MPRKKVGTPVASMLKTTGELSKPKPSALSAPKKLVPFECDWNAYLEANPSMKAWAESNPEAAEKQRIKLEADLLKK